MEDPNADKSLKEKSSEKVIDSKLVEQVLKSLSSGSNIEEKFNILLTKYVEHEKVNKKLNSTIKLNEKKYDALQREKENLQKDYNKNILMKDKLEQVCREQQKLIKSVKNESLTKIKEEEEKRKKIQTKFQESINEISVTLTKNSEENIKLKEDNIEMTKKLKSLAEQYLDRDKQLQKINEQIQLESQLHEAKLAKHQVESTIEKETLLREKQELLDQLLTCKKHIQELQTREDLLREQLNVYTSKYDDFQTSLQKSNDVFTSYKSELEKVYKTNKRLEKECLDWKIKYEKCNGNLIKFITEKHEKEEYIEKLIRQVNQLQKLLRVLQIERNTLHEILKTNNIERPPMPVLPSEPPSVVPLNATNKPPKSNKMDQMVKNCAELKQSLFKLQSQMDEITNSGQKGNDNKDSSKVDHKNNKGGKQKNSKNKNKTNKQNEKTIIGNIEEKLNKSQIVNEEDEKYIKSLSCSNMDNEIKSIENNKIDNVTESIDELNLNNTSSLNSNGDELIINDVEDSNIQKEERNIDNSDKVILEVFDTVITTSDDAPLISITSNESAEIHKSMETVK